MVSITGEKKEQVTLEVSPRQVADALSEIIFKFINDEHRDELGVLAKLKGEKNLSNDNDNR